RSPPRPPLFPYTTLFRSPESIIHSFVEFTDGSVLAQLSPPDMRLPIQYALTYPERVAGPARRLDWAELGALKFEQPDRETFPALDRKSTRLNSSHRTISY